MENDNGGGARRLESTSRRDALKRGALLGGLVWVAPAVQLVGISHAHAQTASPGGGPRSSSLKGISFIAFRFTCADGTFFAKAENITSAAFDCDGPSKKNGGNCGVDQSGAGDGCGRFTLTGHSFDAEGELLAVTVVLTCSGAEFVAGASNCGPTGCVPASGSGASATFVGCS